MDLGAERKGSLVDAALKERSVNVGARLQVSQLHFGEAVYGFADSAIFAERREVGVRELFRRDVCEGLGFGMRKMERRLGEKPCMHGGDGGRNLQREEE